MLNFTQPRLRFAPSPNGYLHLGHAYSALVNAHFSQKLDGKLLLRIEDIDRLRCTEAYEKAIIEDLQWLEISFEPPFRKQSEHFSIYQNALEKLISLGLVYPTRMSRGEVKAIIAANRDNCPVDPDGTPLYPTIERYLQPFLYSPDKNDQFAWRLNMDLAMKNYGQDLYWLEIDNNTTKLIEAHPELWGDVMIARKDIHTSYHLSVVVDDALQDITHVVRGKDLFEATSIHCLLQKILGYPTPIYYHHDLIYNSDGNKLSKSNHDTSLRSLREKGFTIEDIHNILPKYNIY